MVQSRPATVDKPYVYAARVAAADQAKTPAEKVAILRAAVALQPAAPEARIRLIQAAATGRLGDTLLLASRYFLRDHGLPFYIVPAEVDEGYRGEENRSEIANNFLNGMNLSDEERSRLARAVRRCVSNEPALFASGGRTTRSPRHLRRDRPGNRWNPRWQRLEPNSNAGR